jgi:hypothetical protein
VELLECVWNVFEIGLGTLGVCVWYFRYFEVKLFCNVCFILDLFFKNELPFA